MKEYDNKRMIKLWLESHYPLTIVSDRYSGTYSDGDYTAWPLLFYQVPQEIEGSDTVCAEYWWSKDNDTSLVGRGETIQLAMDDLVKRMQERYDSMEEE